MYFESPSPLYPVSCILPHRQPSTMIIQYFFGWMGDASDVVHLLFWFTILIFLIPSESAVRCPVFRSGIEPPSIHHITFLFFWGGGWGFAITQSLCFFLLNFAESFANLQYPDTTMPSYRNASTVVRVPVDDPAPLPVPVDPEGRPLRYSVTQAVAPQSLPPKCPCPPPLITPRISF